MASLGVPAATWFAALFLFALHSGVFARACKCSALTPCKLRPRPAPRSCSDMLYNMGKVLVFMTLPLEPHVTHNAALHAQELREVAVSLSRSRHFLPAFLSLLAPALDASGPDKSEHDLNAVDLVLTVLKQLAEVPNGCAADVAGVSEALVLAYSRRGLVGTLVALAHLLERREFKRVVLLLLDLLFQLLRGQDPEALLRAHARESARGAAAATRGSDAPSDGVAAGGGRRAPAPVGASADAGQRLLTAGAGAGAMPATRHAAAAGPAAPGLSGAKRPRSPLAAAAGAGSRPGGGSDPLAALMAAERGAKAAAVLAAGTARHARFGTLAVMRGLTEGTRRLVSGVAAGEGDSGLALKPAAGAGGPAQRYNPAAPAREQRRGKHDLAQAPLTVEVGNGVGASGPRAGGAASGGAASAGVGGELAPQQAFADRGAVDAARAVLFELAMQLLALAQPAEAAGAPSSPASEKLTRSGAGAEGRADAEGAAGEEEEEEEEAAPVAAFSTLAEAVRGKLMRDSDDLAREDPLKYWHAAGVLLGVHRVAEAARVRSQGEEARRLLGAAVAWRQGRLVAQGASGGAPAAAAAAASPADDGEALLRELEALASSGSDAAAAASDAAGAATAAAPQPLTPRERLYEAVLAGGVFVPGVTAEPVLALLDRWSLGKLASTCEEFSARKQWQPLSIATGAWHDSRLWPLGCRGILAQCHLAFTPLRALRYPSHPSQPQPPPPFPPPSPPAGHLKEVLLFIHGLVEGGRDMHFTCTHTPHAAAAAGAAAAVTAQPVEERPPAALVLPSSPSHAAAAVPLSSSACPAATIEAALSDLEARLPRGQARTPAAAASSSTSAAPAASPESSAAAAASAPPPRRRAPYLPPGSFALGETLLDQLFRDRDLVDLLPKLLRAYEPGRLEGASHLAALVEASHYTLRMAETAATLGMQTRTKRRGGRRGGKGAGGTAYEEGGGSGDEGEEGGAAGRRRRGAGGDAEQEAASERLFELERYAAEFAHPSVVQACTHLLRGYRSNSPKLNYFAVALLRRLAALPNEYAGADPSTGRPLTYEVLTLHVSTLQVAGAILSDRLAAAAVSQGGPGAAQFRDVTAWAHSTAAAFLRLSSSNLLLPVEALFWRGEKSALADLARHYGVIDGQVAHMTEDGERYVAALPADARAAGGEKRVSAAAQERNAAEAQARLNAEAREEDAGEAQLGSEEEEEEEEGAVNDRRTAAKRRLQRKRQAAGGRRAAGKGKARQRGSSSDSDASASSRSSRSSSPSDSPSESGSDSDSEAGRRGKSKAPASGPKRRRLASPAAAGGRHSEGESIAGAAPRAPATSSRGLAAGAGSAASDGGAGDDVGELWRGSDDEEEEDGDGSGGGSWLPAEDAALRSLFPTCAALALAGVAEAAGPGATATATATAAQLLSLDAELHTRRRTPAAVGRRLASLGLRIPQPAEYAASAGAAAAGTGPSAAGGGAEAGGPAAHLQPLYARLGDAAARLFIALGRGGTVASAASAARAGEAAEEEEDDSASGEADVAGSYREAEEQDPSGAAAAAWLSKVVRRAAHARAAAEKQATSAAAAAAAAVAPPAPVSGSSSAASSAAAEGPADGSSQLGPLPPSPASSFAGFSQGGGTFVAAVAALLAGGEPPADIPPAALAAAAAQLGLAWRPAGAAAASSDASSAAAAAGGTAALPSGHPSPCRLPDIPLLPVTPAHFAWFGHPAFAALLQEAGACRGGAAGVGSGSGEAWWRLPAAVPWASLHAVADALAALAGGAAFSFPAAQAAFSAVHAANGTRKTAVAGGKGAAGSRKPAAPVARRKKQLLRRQGGSRGAPAPPVASPSSSAASDHSLSSDSEAEAARTPAAVAGAGEAGGAVGYGSDSDLRQLARRDGSPLAAGAPAEGQRRRAMVVDDDDDDDA